ncbi:MAG: NifB/NifX family molybdenum-iron cluster-binding protein [Candidatus Lokiarchaeota archaeon]|nr:NifB/NifX family molybdenum-iron cluster-binding protein [Candidatus Lokiarchaeota archaeon]
MVIVGIPTFGNKGLKEVMNNRFGRCSSFTFVTIENNQIIEVKSVANDAQGAMGGAGIAAAQVIGNNGATEVIVGNLGPNAMNSLSALNLKIYQSQGGSLTVKELIDLHLSGKLPVLTASNVGAHAGMGGGRGAGMGGGGGRGRQ